MDRLGGRGILVVDVGYTNSKAALFDADLRLVAEHKMASRHGQDPRYLTIEPQPFLAFLARSMAELDAVLPIGVIVPCAHGAAMAGVDGDGQLAMPIMNYMSQPPAEVIADYKKVQPVFSEVFCPLLPLALTHALQLFWMQRMDPAAFAQITAIMPLMQYLAFVLCGGQATEISSIACQTMLIDVNTSQPSSLAKAQGWDRLLPPMRQAWDVLGPLRPGFGLTRPVPVLTGIHDSNANYLRYLAAGLSDFTLLSTGTWSICFNSAADVHKLDLARDTNTNTDVFGHIVGCSRFFAGRELELVARGADITLADIAVVDALVARGSFALPSFTNSGGPVVGSGLKGRFVGPAAETGAERASLAVLYCALMVCCQLDAAHSTTAIVVDGPFSQNEIFLKVLAQLRPTQDVSASSEHNGTATGAACLALIDDDANLPLRPIAMTPVAPAAIAGLTLYQQAWFNQIAT